MHPISLFPAVCHLSEAAGHEGHLPFWLEVINLRLSLLREDWDKGKSPPYKSTAQSGAPRDRRHSKGRWCSTGAGGWSESEVAKQPQELPEEAGEKHQNQARVTGIIVGEKTWRFCRQKENHMQRNHLQLLVFSCLFSAVLGKTQQ